MSNTLDSYLDVEAENLRLHYEGLLADRDRRIAELEETVRTLTREGR